MEFQKYQHIEKLGAKEVEGILNGDVYVFPKLDGTNGQVWFDGEDVKFASRNRVLSLDNDNAGFMAHLFEEKYLISLVTGPLKNCRVYGEWLVPHTLRTYRDDAWKDFYIFDVWDDVKKRWKMYYEYEYICKDCGQNVISPLCVINNPTEDQLIHALNNNNYLIRDGAGIGEGIVLKNYEYTNPFGRQTWAKIVTNQFKEHHVRNDGPPKIKGAQQVEHDIVESMLDEDIMRKVYANICSSEDGWSSKLIPRLLNTVFYDFVRECSWDMVKKFSYPTIDYKKLKAAVFSKTKETMKEVF